jgi:hypothetical protein
MIGFNGTITVPSGHDGRTYDGRRSAQCDMCIQANSRKVVAEAVNASPYWVSMYCSKSLNTEMREALAAYPPGTLLIKADNHGTIDGETGWIKA